MYRFAEGNYRIASLVCYSEGFGLGFNVSDPTKRTVMSKYPAAYFQLFHVILDSCLCLYLCFRQL